MIALLELRHKKCVSKTCVSQVILFRIPLNYKLEQSFRWTWFQNVAILSTHCCSPPPPPADHLDNFGKLSTRAFLSEAHIPSPVSKPYRVEQSSLQLFCFISILFLLCLNVIQSNRKSILNSDAFSSYIKVIKGFTVYTQNEKCNWTKTLIFFPHYQFVI